MRKHGKRWWLAVVVHNCVIHPLLPLAEVLDLGTSARSKLLSALIFKLHEKSYPEEEAP